MMNFVGNIPPYEEVLKKRNNKGWFHKNFPELYSYLLNMEDCSIWGERVYRFYNNIESQPVCPVCGRKVTFLDPKLGYRKYCSVKCAQSDPEYWENIENTVQNKYHVKNVFQYKPFREKYENTMIEIYGNKNPMQCSEIKSRIEKTVFETKGVKNIGVLRTSDVVDFIQIDDKYKYKCPHINCNKCKEKYYLGDRNIHNNRKETHTELCTRLLPEKTNNNRCTYPEIFVREILERHNIKFITNSKSIINPLELDIYIPDVKIAIECNGIYWHSSLKTKNNE